MTPLGYWSPRRPTCPATVGVWDDAHGELLAYAELSACRGRPTLRDAELLRLGYVRTGRWEPAPRGEWVCPVEQIPQPNASPENTQQGGTE